MADQIYAGEAFANGQQVDALRLNNHVAHATLLAGAVTEQTALTPNTVAAGDGLIIHDASVSALRKATAGDILGSGVPIVTSSVTAVAGADLVITPAATFKLDVAGPLEADSLNATGNVTAGGTLTAGGLVTFNATSAVKIPVGTTAQRPATPVQGQLRYNTELDTAEVYSGTEWKAAGGLPFDATGGTIVTIDGYKIHTFTTSGTFTPNLTKEGKIEMLVVGGGGGGGPGNSSVQWTGGGGGGGGAVKYGTLFIARNTSPMQVTVGTGGAWASGVGSSSSFSTLTSLGGNGGNGPSSYNLSYGGQGGLPSTIIGDGGIGRAWDRDAGAGSEGFGSFISGTLVNYGGGGGGAGWSGGQGMGGGGWGSQNNGVGAAPIPNSGGGGGGGSNGNYYAGHAGAAGIVIIRYRVS